MNQLGSFEDVVEKGQSSVKQAAKSAQTGAASFVKTAAGQTSNTPSDQGVNEANAQNPTQQQMSDDDAQKFLQDLYGVKSPTQDPNQQNPAQPLQGHALQNQKPQVKQQNQQTVKAALGLERANKPQEKVPTPMETIKTALGIPGEKPKEDAQSARDTVVSAMGLPDILKDKKTPEEEAKIEALRGQLHGEYYQKLTKPQQQAEETVVDKLEREDQEKKFEDFETNKEKPPPLPATTKQGTGENVVGVSG